MVLPLGDDNSDRRTTPYVNYALIAINVFVFVVLQGMGTNDRFTYAFSTVPQEILTGKDIETPPKQVRVPTGQVIESPGLVKVTDAPGFVYLTLITSMFMHGSIAHILGNMWFLWIFGDNVEDAVGHGRYLVFYLICGVAASLAHVFSVALLSGIDSEEALVPSLGASGAISGVLGGYLLLFPYRRVTVILFRILTQVPAWAAIGLWFAFQVISSLGVLGGGAQLGGVAYAAHIGGFLVGIALIQVFTLGRDTNRRRPPWSEQYDDEGQGRWRR